MRTIATLEEFKNFSEEELKEYGESIPLGYIYNSRGQILSRRDTDGFWYEWTRDKYGNMLTYKDSIGCWSEYTYDTYSNEITYENSDFDYRLYGEAVTEEEFYAFINNQEKQKVDKSVDFTKHDSDKPMFELLQPDFIEEVVRVLTVGAKKYSPDNWKKCEDSSRYVGALHRHINAYQKGETHDPETGLSHLAHATCSLMFLYGLDRLLNDK